MTDRLASEDDDGEVTRLLLQWSARDWRVARLLSSRWLGGGGAP